ncbi:MAG: hypothetical protein ACRD2Q_00160 [Terriglobales bacterium]
MSSPEIERALTEQPLEPQKPPWKPRVAGIVGFVFGPMAGAITSFINLRRLGRRRRASLTLLFTAIGSVLFGAGMYWLPREFAGGVGRLVGHLVSPLLYPYLQANAFEKWEADHPGARSANGWLTIGWGLLGLVAFFLLALAGIFPFLMSEQVTNINVYSESPDSIMKGEEFVLRIKVENTADRPQVLNAIDLGSGYLEGATILKTVPAHKKTETNFATSDRSYMFDQAISAKGEQVVEFHSRGMKAGDYPSIFSVCVNSDTNCEAFNLTITVRP